MTNINNGDIDLELSLGCTAVHNVETEPKDDSGAGVNASSAVDMAFAASDPLSELVWSPHKGLSLKCADSGIADKKPFLLWNVGPSDLNSSPSQSGRFKGTFDENAVDKNIIVSREEFQTYFMGSDEVGPEDLGAGRLQLHGSSSKLNMETDEPLAGKIKQDSCTREKCRNEDGEGSSQAIIPTDKYLEGHACPISNSPTKTAADKAAEYDVQENSRNGKRTSYATSLPALDKEECIAENDVNPPGIEEARDQYKEKIHMDGSVPLETSPTHSRTSLYRRKGKGKALSEGNANREISKEDEEDSHESVESCNSAGLAPKGKKRWLFEQQFSVGNKRIRKHMQGDIGTESTLARSSSFMSWISNMVKGFSKSNLEESPTPALTFNANNEDTCVNEIKHQEIVMYDKDLAIRSRAMGFQTVFHSMYCPTSKVDEIEITKEDHSLGESKKPPSADKVLVGVPPISCHLRDDVLDANNLMSNYKINQSTMSHTTTMETQIMPFVGATKEDSRTASAENRASGDIGCRKAKIGCSSSDSMSRRKTNVFGDENIVDSSASDAAYDISNKNQALCSLWISRFSKAPRVLNEYDTKPTAQGTPSFSTEWRKPNPQAKTSIKFPIEQESLYARETSGGDQAGDDVAASSKENYESSYEMSRNNLLPIIPSAMFKKSEALASLFARRLDALKHIVPSSTKSEYNCYTRATCFFCGRIGHDLSNCLEVAESELEVLIRNIRSYDGAEESSCLCIRCFQLDHWAISCPASTSNRSQQSEHKFSLINQNSSNLQLFTSTTSSPSLLEIKQGHPIDHTEDLMHIREQFWFARTRCGQVQKERISDPAESSLKENTISFNPVHKEISNVPKGIFNVIRSLRLSRVDILKWMNSNTSLSHLDGFFLRLRLGKWETGLGGTGYYVACITGLKGETLERDSQNCISVNVCGVKCSVGSKYVSNQDFLEDELNIWWHKTLESGGKVPKEEDLRVKLEERMKLGF